MNKQILIASGAFVLVVLLFFFGKTVEKKSSPVKATVQNNAETFDISRFIIQAKQKLTPQQTLTVGKLENSVTRGDVQNQQINANNQLANFWKDSARVFAPYIYYLSQAAKLENSEKNLTFAAQLILETLRHSHDEDQATLNWMTEQAVMLFEKAISIDPENEDLKIGLASCYIYGNSRNGKPEQTMKGIQQLLAVVRKDSTNMKAQLVLGVGGFVSGQYDKAIDRLNKVVKAEPQNMEAIAYLADAYSNNGEKEEAVKWYQVMKKLANDPEYDKEIDQRIKQLQ